MRKLNFKKGIACALTLAIVGSLVFGIAGVGSYDMAYNRQTGDCYYGEEDDGTVVSWTDDDLNYILNLAIKNGFSVEKLEKSFNSGVGIWLKQIMIEYGKYPMNPISVTEYEEDGKYWPSCIGTPGYTADLTIGNMFPQNAVGIDLDTGKFTYYVDGRLSTDPADAGKPVDISMLAAERFGTTNPLTDKYLYNPDLVIEVDYTEQRTVVTLPNVTVKDIPHPTGKALGSVPAGTVMEVTGITSNGWFRVNYNGQDAYMYYMFLG